PSDVKRDIVGAFARLRDPVAIRSSATVEDDAAGAFAGVYRTVLDVRAGRLIASIVDVWASAFTYAALTHAMRQNVDPGRIGMAVLVQEMLAPERSGVLFTRDAIDPDVAVVAITSGAGAALADGVARGETKRVSRRTRDALVRAGLRLEKRWGQALDI